jgi:hypothetical protein
MLRFVTLLLTLSLFFNFSYASAATVAGYCAGSVLVNDANPPSIAGLICPIVRIFNLLILASGLVFAMMIGYGSIKLSMALGDPKGFDAAKMTLFYAFLGFGVVLGSFTILSILSGFLGAGIISNPLSLFDGFLITVGKLMKQVGICDATLGNC